MTIVLTWIAIAWLILFTFGMICSACRLGLKLHCDVTHWHMRRTGSRLQCPHCGVYVHEVVHQPKMFVYPPYDRKR
jgi:hypothetical protein